MSSDTPPSIPPRKKSDKPAPAGGKAPASKATPAVKPAAATKPAAAKPEPAAPAAKPAAAPSATAGSAPAAKAPATGAARSGAPARGTSAAPAAATTTAVRPDKAPSPAAASATPPAAEKRPTASDRPAKDKKAAAAGSATGPRRVRLSVSRVDPWSVMKLSFLVSFAAGIMLVVATCAIWFALDGLEVFAKINDLATEILADSDIDLMQYVELPRVASLAALIAVIDIFLITALATIGAFLYNITAALVGGLHLTMTDD